MHHPLHLFRCGPGPISKSQLCGPCLESLAAPFGPLPFNVLGLCLDLVLLELVQVGINADVLLGLPTCPSFTPQSLIPGLLSIA